VELPAGLVAGFGEGIEEAAAVAVVAEDVLAMVAAAPERVNGAGILHAQWAGHDAMATGRRRIVNC
jgi:hypothetical protein